MADPVEFQVASAINNVIGIGRVIEIQVPQEQVQFLTDRSELGVVRVAGCDIGQGVAQIDEVAPGHGKGQRAAVFGQIVVFAVRSNSIGGNQFFINSSNAVDRISMGMRCPFWHAISVVKQRS